MAQKSDIAVGDELLLKVQVVRVDQATITVSTQTASGTAVRLTIRQDNDDIVEVKKVPKEGGRRRSIYNRTDWTESPLRIGRYSGILGRMRARFPRRRAAQPPRRFISSHSRYRIHQRAATMPPNANQSIIAQPMPCQAGSIQAMGGRFQFVKFVSNNVVFAKEAA